MACERFCFLIGALTGRLITTVLHNTLKEESISSFRIVSKALFMSFQSSDVVQSPPTDRVVKYKTHNTKTKVHVPPNCVERCIWRSARSISVTPQINRPLSEPVRLSILLPLLQENSVFTHRLRPEHLPADYINVIYFQRTG